MIIDENEQGIVCINGKPVYDHYREHDMEIACLTVMQPASPGKGAPGYACLSGMLALIQLGDSAAAYDALRGLHRSHTRAAAEIVNLPYEQVRELEAGWCAFRLKDNDSEFYRLGEKAFAQCRAALFWDGDN